MTMASNHYAHLFVPCPGIYKYKCFGIVQFQDNRKKAEPGKSAE